MRTSLFFTLLIIFIVGCSKDEPKVVPMADTVAAPAPQSQPQPLDGLPPHIRSGVKAVDRSKIRDHATAAEAYLNMPDSAMPVPIPAALRPFKNPRLVNATDSTAIYMFTVANGSPGEMFLIRTIFESDTIWIPLHILPR